ncbi:Fumarylacetoacetase [Pseudocohnilembus persalinus]|uniref:Fumarylacetoacetase n=1 Tax=Pseudocohnilembus persalinus TaxID=266149 RepID=A0A0V0R6I9_PSEPJ|nr:Fumarylacetoacetase [Pseudocohnilembus persalinus]|eukprot:KRX09962.1 Fumarylacetoacetase [Pseudocohnilembus persalinus]
MNTIIQNESNSHIIKINKGLENNQINHELEIGFVLSQGGSFIDKQCAKNFVGGYFLCQDLTDSTLQSYCKENKYSWELGKCRDQFLPVSQYIEKQDIGDFYEDVELELLINGQQVYRISTQKMIFDLYDQIAYVSKFMYLNEGDLFLTGTPKLGPFQVGDILQGNLYKKSQMLTSLKVQTQVD